MNELQFADDVLARIRARGGPYHERGYLFVLAHASSICSRGLDGSAARDRGGAGAGPAATSRASSSGCWRPVVLAHWGVTRTEDFGRIVFTLVEVGLLVTQPGDQRGGFRGGLRVRRRLRRCLRVAGRARRLSARSRQGGSMETGRVAGVPEVLAGNPDPPLGLRPRRRADHLQGLGLHQSGLRVQSPHRQRRDHASAGRSGRAISEASG